MGRKLLLGPKNVIEETGLDANKTGTTTDCDNVDLVSYDLIWANGNTPVMTATFEFSHDGTTYYTLDFGSTISISGASGQHRIDIEPNFKYVRPVITRSSGDADVTCIVKGTTKGA